MQESKSDILLEKCRRAFKKVEGGGGKMFSLIEQSSHVYIFLLCSLFANNMTKENGFIPVDKLGEVLDELDLRAKVGGDSGLQALQAYLEVSQSR